MGGFDPKNDLVVVIMAGGAGTRFWPASTEAKPKQFLRLFGDRSLFQQAVDRTISLVGAERVLVLTSERFSTLCREQAPELPAENIIGEPMRRDTAAAVALASLSVEERFGPSVMAVLTSDHLIGPQDVFHSDLLSACVGAAKKDALYTFGIPPTHAATGFGYLELGDEISAGHHELIRFVEKPDAKTAQSYLEGGRHLWNSGMFVWHTDRILDEFERQLPAHLKHLRPAAKGNVSLANAFEPLEKISIDFAVMEGAELVRCVKASFDWKDVGGFLALGEHLAQDANLNSTRCRFIAKDSNGNVVFSEDEDELIGLFGVDDLLVVRAGNKTLVCPKNRAEDLKELVSLLDEEDR